MNVYRNIPSKKSSSQLSKNEQNNVSVLACQKCGARVLDFAMQIHHHESHSTIVEDADGVDEQGKCQHGEEDERNIKFVPVRCQRNGFYGSKRSRASSDWRASMRSVNATMSMVRRDAEAEPLRVAGSAASIGPSWSRCQRSGVLLF